jgi:hypothetical protein
MALNTSKIYEFPFFQIMLTQLVVRSLRSAARSCVATTLRRNIGMSAVVYQKADMDPIQKSFVDKVHAYAQKSK